MGTLSVRENLAFSAALRLPMSVTKKERSDKVESVIYELGLSHVANTKVRLTSLVHDIRWLLLDIEVGWELYAPGTYVV